MKIKKVFYIILGCIGLGLGAVGAAVPMLPAFPFLVLTAFCFARSSERLHDWFLGTKLYKNNLESYIQRRGMTRPAKRRVMTTVTVVMSLSFLIMFLKGLYIPCGILFFVWIGHIFYFLFGVKTLDEAENCPECKKV